MTERKNAVYGSLKSPITSDLIASVVVRLDVQVSNINNKHLELVSLLSDISTKNIISDVETFRACWNLVLEYL